MLNRGVLSSGVLSKTPGADDGSRNRGRQSIDLSVSDKRLDPVAIIDKANEEGNNSDEFVFFLHFWLLFHLYMGNSINDIEMLRKPFLFISILDADVDLT